MEQPEWLTAAWRELGVREHAGAATNPTVRGYYRDSGHPDISDDEVAWCAAFVGACLARAGLSATGSLRARSYAVYGQAITEPALGAIAVLSRGHNPALGHVGFVVGATADRLMLLGGNQGDAVTVAGFDRARLVALRWPTPAGPAGERPETKRRDRFEPALAHVLEMEGGYTDDIFDPGGPTNRGITLSVYAAHNGVEVTHATVGALKSELKRIPMVTVRKIYRSRYWQPGRCHDLPAGLDLFHFDATVNHGVAGAARLLQAALDVATDGEIGSITLEAARRRPVAQTLQRYAELRRHRYRSLPHFWRFGRGWLARVDKTLRVAAYPASAAPIPSREEKTMEPKPDIRLPTTETPESTTKWWGQSVTIWGALITALSTVLPLLGPALGLNLTPELVHVLGDQVALLVQAFGGLIGTIMTVYGRTRASTRLLRRPVPFKL